MSAAPVRERTVVAVCVPGLTAPAAAAAAGAVGVGCWLGSGVDRLRAAARRVLLEPGALPGAAEVVATSLAAGALAKLAAGAGGPLRRPLHAELVDAVLDAAPADGLPLPVAAVTVSGAVLLAVAGEVVRAVPGVLGDARVRAVLAELLVDAAGRAEAGGHDPLTDALTLALVEHLEHAPAAAVGVPVVVAARDGSGGRS